ncbi:hypothetical protein B0J11DRAFT_423738 [Dendryphion nanum]|uniref:Carrier domain-containing protein n=1 Tax=Dendryphion nanum TaxID=256645 RepID=A0A9P9J2W8_9PLEO|nr:hypothetical protein B0J11DRAFT_423738 [Dendryphion nanum]
MLHEPIPELSILNKKPALLDGPRLLHQLVAKNQTTTSVAIDFLENASRRSISYDALHTLSDALARRITDTLSKLENVSDIVPVLLPQSPELYITLLAVLKAGKAFCPIGLDTPHERLRFILDDVAADLLITDSVRASTIQEDGHVHLLLVDEEQTPCHAIQITEVPRVDASNLAYVLYTSGSTGLPKAVSVSHRAVTQSLLAHQRHIPIFSRFLQFATPTFDVSIFEIFFPLIRGCTLVGCNRGQLLEDLPGVIRAMEVDAAELTPTVVSALLQGRESVPGLKLLLTIGEMLTKQVIDAFGGNADRPSMLWGMYGPTEAAIHCTLQPAFQVDSPVGNIGILLDTVSAFIAVPVDESKSSTDLIILPSGEVGELVLGGPQIANEYLNRPELNATAFLHHPEFGYLYRTGDKARITQDRSLECFGRIKSGQVKLRGQRVELGEIEQVIAKVKGCQAVTTIIINDNLVAFCAVGDCELKREVISKACLRWLPSHMIPTEIIFVSRMPQLPSGKVDKNHLEEQYLQQCKDENQLQPEPNSQSTNTTGAPILRILELVLKRHISTKTKLQYAGLDSLRAIRVSSLLRKAGYNIGATDVLSASTAEELALTCWSQNSNHPARRHGFNGFRKPILRLPELSYRQSSVADIIPCTPLQQAMLAETVVRPSSYCNWIEVELHEPHTFSEIRTCIQRLAHATEILRSGFCITSMSNSFSGSSFAQIIWKQLDASQITEVTSFSKRYSLGSVNSLLRPLAIQVHANLHRPRILFQIHHALYDGWSFELLLRDFADLMSGKTLTTRPQYRDVVEYHTFMDTDKSKAASLEYWTNLLTDFQPTKLPNFNGQVVSNTTLSRVAVKSSINAHTLFNRANDLAINPQVFYQAALAYIIGLYSGISDVTFGTVTSGRTIPITHIEEIIGPCIATLPLRINLSGNSTIRQLLNTIHGSNRSMLQHCSLPLRDIMRLCGRQSGGRIFDTLFVWQQSLNSKETNIPLPQIMDSADELEFGLTLEFEPRGKDILSKVTYDPSFIPPSQIGHLLSQIDEVVEHFIHNLDANVDDIARCFSRETLSIANPAPIQESIIYGPSHTVEKWASSHPERNAVVLGTTINGKMVPQQTLTYASLNNRANQLAHALIAYNLQEDEIVCVLLDKSIDLYVSILAVLKTGHGYLPIIPESPHERTSRILADSKVTLCISTSSTSQRLHLENSCKVLNVDAFDYAEYSSENPGIEYNGSRLAYAVFTSGSTGTPKGVLVTQDNLMSNIMTLHGIYPTSPESRMLQSCSQAFDVSVFEIFFTWYSGMCLCAATKDELYDNLEESIVRLGITHLSMTPTVASLVNPVNVPNVQFLVTAGEALNEHVRRQWMGKGLYQGYGPSETTNICTVRASVCAEDLINNIGQPFSNTSAFVLAPNSDHIVPRGAIGELCFGGAQVFRGYLNMPELNAQKILVHSEFGRIYRSGDMGMLLPDNSILFVGRSDDQVKIRGQRVELGEITSKVLDNVTVDDCVTLLFHEDDTSSRIITFWVPSGAPQEKFAALSSNEFVVPTLHIFEALMSALPSYMIPTHLIPISRIPLTPQTKIDQRLLFATYKNLPNHYLESITYDPSPKNDEKIVSDTENTMAETVSKILRISQKDISRHSPLFSLGLDSISAIHLAHALRDRGFGNISVSTILRHPTIAQLCSRQNMGSVPEQASVKPQSDLSRTFSSQFTSHTQSLFEKRNIRVEKILPCTPLQAAMLSSSDSMGDSSYCNTTVFKINGNLKWIQDCWSRMFERHEILRTAFIPTDDPRYAFAQVVIEYAPPTWDLLDPNDMIEGYVQKTIPELLSLQQPPLRLATRKMGDSIQVIFCCHHALYDGTAVTVLLSEIEDLYHERKLLPAMSYESYLKHIVDIDLSAADEFWENHLRGMEPTIFPNLTSKTSDNAPSTSSMVRKLQIPLSVATKFSQSLSTSLLPTLQAAWVKILHFYIGEGDVCFGNVVSGRSIPEPNINRLVAPCFNTVPVRVDFDFGNTNADLVKNLHTINVESSPYQLTPLRRIQGRNRNEAGRLFDTLFILQQPSTQLDESIWTIEQDFGSMDLPIVCELSPDTSADCLTMTLHYQTSTLSELDSRYVVESFDCALQSIVKFSPSAARDTVGFPDTLLAMRNLNFTRFDELENQLLHSSFENNAEQCPDRIALEYIHTGGRISTWSFKELNEAANQIANALIEFDIALDDVIPVVIPKRPEFYASILGILKAGAAFTPIHPDLPVARKKFMLTELQPKVILCVGRDDTDWCDGVQILNVTTTKGYSTKNPCIPGLVPTNMAYNLYTSGTTGVPKAVSVDHRSPMHTIKASKELIPWSKDSRLLQYAAISFDMCYYDCFLAWSFGFTLCASDQDNMINNLASVIVSLNVDLLDLTPSVAVSISRVEVPCVKWLFCIGESMSTSVVKEWEGACVNSYGPTEAAFCTTIFPVQKNTKVSVIGKPFPTTSFAVFPRTGERALPVFGVGELLIGGAQLARGYYGKSQLTMEKFVQRNGQRFYKSGDIVRMLGNGNFEFVGRVDDQVKIRGLRVELGEINHVLQHCDERIASVSTQIFKKDDSSKDQLSAFVATSRYLNSEEQQELKIKAREMASKTLPAYMVPQFVIIIDKIPRSTAGKVDRKVLMEAFRQSSDVNSELGLGTGLEMEHKWTETEHIIREQFARLSHTSVEDITPKTSIYQLGLDSISAVQIAAGLRKQNITVIAADVLKHTTCVDLALHIERATHFPPEKTRGFDFASFEAKHRPRILEQHDIEDQQIETIRPCTPLQQGMLSQFVTSDGAVYFNYIQLRLCEDIKLRRLKEAWNCTMKKFQMLRTGFFHTENVTQSWAMVHLTAVTTSLPWEDETEESDPEPAQDWLEQSQNRALKCLHKPLWRVRLTTVGDQKYLDLAMFHALFDAASLQIMLDNVASEYYGATNNDADPLEPALATILQQSHADDGEREAFWRDLGRISTPTRFPNLAPLQYTPKPFKVVTRLSSDTLQSIEAGCRTSNTSLQVAGIASWASIISAYTGENTVTLGVVLSGRNDDATSSVAFPCITTVPYVVYVDDDKKKMLHNIMLLNANIQTHQFTPLQEIHKLMGNSSESLFDSIFAFQKLQVHDTQNHPWSVVDEKASTEYPISIELEPKHGRLEFRLTILPHVVPEEHAVLILDQLDYLFHQIVFSESPSVGVSTIEPTLLSVTPPKEPILPSNISLLHEFVEDSACKYPDSIAFEFATSIQALGYTSSAWTYAELDAEGNKIAHLLQSHGVKQGDLVGVCFNKCPEASFAILGILKAGCAFVALDPGAPTTRRAFIIKDSGAEIVLTMKNESRDLEDAVDIQILNLDEIDSQGLATEKPSLLHQINPQDRSYCLYTSGTTGTPKGCELTHENAVQALLAFQRLFSGHWNKESRWLQFASFHFDVSVLEQYWSWSVGITVVSAPRDLLFEDLAAAIKCLDITHIDLTPSLARLVHPDEVPSLCKGVFITGGESLKQEILDVWGPKGVIYNGYGPTEATIGVTMYPRVPANGKPSNIGPQFDNVGSYVLKPGTDIPVLRGGVGELCVSGKLVGKGYLNRDELTTERFPFIASFGERVYRTGDLVRILHDGSFDFLGRADDQVKLRGQRLEIGEINSVIRKTSSEISDVATLVLRHPKQQKEQLVSFVVTKLKRQNKQEIVFDNEGHLSRAKEMCQETLPGYMVPTYFIALSGMPLSANNKVDTRALKNIYDTCDVQQLSIGSSRPSDGEWTKNELCVRDVLSDMFSLNSKDIKRISSIFELGLDSISVISFARALKKAGFPQTSASLIMRNTSIIGLGKALSNIQSSANDRGSVIAAQQIITAIQHRHRRNVAKMLAIGTSEIETIAPCTPLQQGMIARSLESDQGLYFNEFRFRLGAKVDKERLFAVWKEAFFSTQILRTVFCDSDDGYIQAVVRWGELPHQNHTIPEGEPIHDFLDNLKKQWREVNQTLLLRPFQIQYVSHGSQNILVVQIFHALYDGISAQLLFERIWDGYNDTLTGNNGPHFHDVLPYGPLCIVAGAKDFWQNQLSGNTFFPILPLTNTPGESSIGIMREIPDLHAYENIRRKLNVTHQAIAQACWSTVLRKHAQGPVTMGMVVSGRSINFDGADRVMGPLFNTIPYHYRHQAGTSWTDAIKRAHDFNAAAHTYQHTPLRDIMKWQNRSPSKPLFDNLFVYQIGDNEECIKNQHWRLEEVGAEADYPIAFEVEQRNNGSLLVTLVSQGHIADEKSADLLLDEFEAALRMVMEDPNALVGLDTVDGIGKEDELPAKETSKTSKSNNDVLDFEWTHNAISIREEIVRLTDAGNEDISPSTSIFELGLDSIDAIKLSSKLKKRGIDLPVSAIMRGLTIANMTENVRTGVKIESQASSDVNFELNKKELGNYLTHSLPELDNIEQILPLTPLQEGMVADMIASDYTRYYNHDVMKLAPDTDLEQLRKALKRVVENSPILRTSFIEIDDPEVDSSFAQIVHREAHEFVQHYEVHDEPDFPKFFDQAREEARSSSWRKAPFHVQFVETLKNKYLVLSIAHALYDGFSLGLLHSDIYHAYINQYTPRGNYEPALREILTGLGTDASAFWKDYLSNAKSTCFSRRSATHDTETVHRQERFSTHTVRDIQEFSKKNNITLQTLGQTAFAVVLAYYARSLDVAFGSVLSGRDDDSVSKLMFPTMNTVAIRTILHGKRQELLRYVQENFVQVKQYQHFPLRRAQALAGTQGSLFESLFIYQKRMEPTEDTATKLYTSVEGMSEVEYPVCVEMEAVGGQTVWRCAVKEEVFDRLGAKRLLERLDQVLGTIIEDSNAPVIEFTPEGTSVCGLPAFENHSYSRGAEILLNGELSLNDTESATMNAIREVLSLVSKIPKEEIDDGMTIYHIGLDSISAIKVSSLLRKQSIILSVGEMLKAGTLKKMAIQADQRTTSIPKRVENTKEAFKHSLAHINTNALLQKYEINQEDVEQILPASAGQIYMLSMWIKSRGALLYPEFTYLLDGPVSFDTIKKAWQDLSSVNPILRTRFFATDDERIPFIQVALRQHTPNVVEVTWLKEEEPENINKNVGTANPGMAHLFVSSLPTGWALRLKIHHALYDGVSLPLLMQQFQELCNGITCSPPTATFEEFLVSEINDTALKTRETFWMTYLRDIEQRHIPQPHSAPTSKVEVFKPRMIQSTKVIEASARKHGISPQSLFLAAYSKIYATFVNTPDTSSIVIGLYLAKRSHPTLDLSSSAIPTVNLVPLHIASPLVTDIWTIAAQIQRDIQEISNPTNSAVGLWEIEKWTGVTIDTFVNFLTLPDTNSESSTPRLEIGMVSTARWEEDVCRMTEIEQGGLEVPDELVDEQVRASYLYAIDVEATMRNGALDVGIFAPGEMVDLEQAERMVGDLRKELEALEA